MVAEIHRLRDKPGETEKITINVGFVDLGHIDLLVREGFYAKDLEAVKAARGKLRIQVVGLATIAEDVTPELARATIESITVLGALQASKAVKVALSDRIG